MADDAPAAESASITFSVKSSNDAKYTFTLPESTTVADLKGKLSGSEYADTPAERQRLIYSGRVLKDSETLATYKIKDGHTIHLVKSAASNQRQNPPSQPATASTATTPSSVPGVPTNIAAGTGNNPLAGLTGARYAGFAQLPGAGMFGPDGGMGPPPDPDQMLNMLENPQFQATMNEALSNPALIDLMIQQNPMLREMGPGVRQMMQSPEFRRMLTDPASLRRMTQMQRAFGGAGLGGMGNAAFPAPGVTNTTPEENRGQQQQGNNQDGGAAPPTNPFQAALARNFADTWGVRMPWETAQQNAPESGANANATGEQATTEPSAQNTQTQQGQNTQAQNPFAALFNPALFGAAQGQPGSAADMNNIFNPQNNPFMRDPALLQSVMQAMGGGNAGVENPWGSFFGGAPAAASQPDTRPPEERYAEQLRQLNDMGFYDFDRNITALRRSGGSVQGAINFLLNG